MSKLILLLTITMIIIPNMIICAPRKPKDEGLYASSGSNVMLLGRRNFDQQITNARTKGVSIVHYFRNNDQGSKEFAVDYGGFANDMKGVFKICAIDCDENYEICEKERISRTPLVRVYPPLPIPAYDHEGELNTKLIMGEAARYVQSNVLEVNATNINKFIQDSPSVPKVLLFTDKKGIPLLFKALSMAFEKKLFFGIVRSEHTDVFDQYDVRTTPKILVVKTSERKPFVYQGELKFQPIFDFLNVYSEAFVAGGEKMDSSKPWLKELVPELSKKSANDICFKTEGGLCVIVLSRGVPEKNILDTLEEVQKDNKENSNYKFMWLNVDTNTEFAGLFNVEDYPKIAVFSPGKRKKFLLHEGDIDASSLQNTFDKINYGDGRFNHIRTDLPELV